MNVQPVRDHLFISYATEDAALAEWLALKLTAEGYFVWCDRFKLLGGESYPVEIDLALKQRTFRMIALLSKHSIHKPNPMKERTLASNLARERHEDFIIPLNVDGLTPGQLDWMSSNLSFIPFTPSWATGLAALLRKLATIGTPRQEGAQGRHAVLAALPEPGDVRSEPETLYANCLAFLRIPDRIRALHLDRPLEGAELGRLGENWTFYRTDPQTLFSFAPPPPALPAQVLDEVVTDWRTSADPMAANIVSGLLEKACERKLRERGLRKEFESRWFYFPSGLLQRDRLPFRSYTGRMSGLQVVGSRKVGEGRLQHHLGLRIRVRRDLLEGFTAILELGVALPGLAKDGNRDLTNARRKKVTKNWWNHEWVTRLLAVCQHLANDHEHMVIGVGAEQVVLAGRPLALGAAVSIDDVKLAAWRHANRVPVFEGPTMEDDDE